MNVEKIVYRGGMCFVALLFILAMFGARKAGSIASNVTGNCEPIDLYIISDRGHMRRVYDCTDIELENDNGN